MCTDKIILFAIKTLCNSYSEIHKDTQRRRSGTGERLHSWYYCQVQADFEEVYKDGTVPMEGTVNILSMGDMIFPSILRILKWSSRLLMWDLMDLSIILFGTLESILVIILAAREKPLYRAKNVELNFAWVKINASELYTYK